MVDVRFPTSLSGDGTDAMYVHRLDLVEILKRDADYKAIGIPTATIPLRMLPYIPQTRTSADMV